MTEGVAASQTEGVDDSLLPPGTPIDLDNCAREPIHIPGSIQPRGVLLVVRDPDLVVTQVSRNVPDLLGVAVEDALDRPLSDLIGTVSAETVERAIASFTDLRDRNPIEVEIDVAGTSTPFDVIVHREDIGLLLIEIETAYGPRPFSFPNTYLAVRGAVAELNRAADLGELYDITARSVRDLTGFDRVMVYRYDHEYNGEVVAEAKRDDLNSFLGLHYPATDIPAQARALYEKNWIRLISDIGYTPSPLTPVDNPVTGAPIDLTHATLRSVSPIHIEYLKNMGVGASMSISLLRDGKLWGLIACHHYSGPHTPPYGTRAAAEFLGSTLSLRLVDRFDEEALRNRLDAQTLLAKISDGLSDPRYSVAGALLGAPSLADLVAADGVAVRIQDEYAVLGAVPERAAVEAVAAWGLEVGADGIAATDNLGRSCPDLPLDPAATSGALVLTLPEDQFIAWFRAEELRSVDWGGDPHNKAIAVQEADAVRISPRKSFERWSETVRGRSTPWTAEDRDSAHQLRGRVVETMYQRARDELRLAERLQRSLLPDMPDIPDWQLTAFYEPARGGRIGGDWYDAFPVPGGRLAVVLGDVAGHGLGAAGTMAQLRNVLRAHLFDGLSPAEALARLNDFTVGVLPGVFATVAAACIDLTTGEVQSASAGHLTPFLVMAGRPTEPAPIRTSPPIGVAGVAHLGSRFALDPGAGLVLFSDGLIERRDEDIYVSRARLAGRLDRLGSITAAAVWDAVQDGAGADDATVLTVRRPG